jgi:hypothetical protein
MRRAGRLSQDDCIDLFDSKVSRRSKSYSQNFCGELGVNSIYQLGMGNYELRMNKMQSSFLFDTKGTKNQSPYILFMRLFFTEFGG